MSVEEKYMWRCLQLARNGKGAVSPNPMVGAVIVHEGRIIGEGFHRCCGEPHAEVNAVNSVRNRDLLKESTMYVSLEPCSHHGKTPPCADMIIVNAIPNVVVACLDPYPNVAGRGIKKMKDAGVNVTMGVLEKEAIELNKEFITSQTKCRPYVYLKWAQSKDGFLDKKRSSAADGLPVAFSNPFTQMLVHKKRAEVDAIMVGTNTAVLDNPRLNTRLWYGKSPRRVVLDKDLRIDEGNNLLKFDGFFPTIVFTEKDYGIVGSENADYRTIAFDDNLLENVLSVLRQEGIHSLMVEGGSILLQSFIDKGLWDEAFVETNNALLYDGISCPKIAGESVDECTWGNSRQIHLISTEYKIL